MSKTTPTYTLVRRSQELTAQGRAKQVLLDHLKKSYKKSVNPFIGLDSTFAKALVSSTGPRDVFEGSTDSMRRASAKKADRVVKNVTRHKGVQKVGILDLSSWVSVLPRLLQRLNSAQESFTFFDVQAPVPAGLTKKADWYVPKGFELDAGERKEIASQIYSNEFFRVGEGIRRSLGLDFLIGLTPSMVTLYEKSWLYWNHFSASRGSIILVSTADLRDFAVKASRTFEALVAYLLISQFLCTINPRLDFHEDRGCLFDENADRVSIVKSAKIPAIEPKCLARIEPRYLKAAEKLLTVLRKL